MCNAECHRFLWLFSLLYWFWKERGTAARERAVPLSQCHLQSTTISLYGPALCFYKNHNTTQTITVFLLPLMMVIFGGFYALPSDVYFRLPHKRDLNSSFHKKIFQYCLWTLDTNYFFTFLVRSHFECLCQCTSRLMLLISFMQTKPMSTLVFSSYYQGEK